MDGYQTSWVSGISVSEYIPTAEWNCWIISSNNGLAKQGGYTKAEKGSLPPCRISLSTTPGLAPHVCSRLSFSSLLSLLQLFLLDSQTPFFNCRGFSDFYLAHMLSCISKVQEGEKSHRRTVREPFQAFAGCTVGKTRSRIITDLCMMPIPNLGSARESAEASTYAKMFLPLNTV